LTFPVYLRFGGISIPPHPLFECLAYAVGFRVYVSLRKVGGDVVSGDTRWWVIAAATVGAAGGSRLLGILEVLFYRDELESTRLAPLRRAAQGGAYVG
jgi:phosphatidylglycerol---prolipoprotein diacylglyceryl transferase